MPDMRQIRFIAYVEAIRDLYSEKNKYQKRTGERLLSLDQIEARLNICESCHHFTGLKCDLCGCCMGSKESHFNALAFPTKRCPDVPPKWVEVE